MKPGLSMANCKDHRAMHKEDTVVTCHLAVHLFSPLVSNEWQDWENRVQLCVNVTN